MTSPLRRKRPTTVPARTTPATTAAERRPAGTARRRTWVRFLAALLLACGFALPAPAQGPGGPGWGPPVTPSSGPGWGQQGPGSVPGPAGNSSLTLPPAPVPADPYPMAPGNDLRLPPAPRAPEKTYFYSREAPRPAAPAPEKTYFYTREPVPPTSLPAGVRRAVLQPGKVPERLRTPEEAMPEYNIRLDVPGLQRLAGQLESEAALMERMRQEARARGERLVFPEEPTLAKEPYLGRNWSPLTRVVEPYYVCYGRLLFEQKNFERYGWDLGPVTPLVSTGKFFWDVLALPYNLGTRPCQQYEVSSGYCLPGDPVPLLLYPPEISVTGLMTEAAVVTALFFIFP
jgi:hypothetical protein